MVSIKHQQQNIELTDNFDNKTKSNVQRKINNADSIRTQTDLVIEANDTDGFTQPPKDYGKHVSGVSEHILDLEIEYGSRNDEQVLKQKSLLTSTNVQTSISDRFANRSNALNDVVNYIAQFGVYDVQAFKQRLALCSTSEDFARIENDRLAGRFNVYDDQSTGVVKSARFSQNELDQLYNNLRRANDDLGPSMVKVSNTVSNVTGAVNQIINGNVNYDNTLRAKYEQAHVEASRVTNQNIVEQLNRISNVPPEMLPQLHKLTKMMYKRGFNAPEVYKVLQSINIGGKSLGTPQLELQLRPGNIGAIIRNTFATGVTPYHIVNEIMSPIEGIVRNPILVLALKTWASNDASTGSLVAGEMYLTLDRYVQWLRSSLTTAFSRSEDGFDNIIDIVDNLIRQMLQMLLNWANVELSKLGALIALIPLDTAALIKAVLTKFGANTIINVSYRPKGLTQHDLVENGFSNQKNIKSLELEGSEITSLIVADTPGTKAETNRSPDISSVINLKGNDIKLLIDDFKLPNFMK